MSYIKTGVQMITRQHVDFDSDALTKITELEVLVGVPEAETERTGDDAAQGITNASLAYIHDNGAPEAHIPPRPFMIPGIEAGMEAIAKQLDRATRAAIGGNVEGVMAGFHGAGLAAQRAIKNKILEGVPPPLSEYTLRERAAKGRKGAALELKRREAGETPGMELALPLVDTHEMLNSISYVIRSREERK